MHPENQIERPTMLNVVGQTLGRGRALGLDKADLSILLRCAQDHQRYLNKLAAAIKVENHQRAALLISRILNSPKSKLVGLLRTLRPKTSSAITLAHLRNRVGQLDPFKPIPELVRRTMERKLDGGLRPIIKFGWRRHALQQLCVDILLITLPAHDFDYLEPNHGGIESAAIRLIEGVAGDEYQYVVLADVRNCYASVNKDRVADLIPLPRAVTQNVILLEEETEIVEEEEVTSGLLYPPLQVKPYPNSFGRQGLPQGAPTSRIIVSRACLGSLLGATSFANRIVLFGDDMAVLARDEDEAKGILECLRSCLKTCPVGPLVLGRAQIQSKFRPVYFTKYGFRKLQNAPRVHITPSYKSFDRFQLRSGKMWLDGDPQTIDWELEAYRDRWQKAFPLCQANEFLAKQARRAQKLGCEDARDWAEAHGLL